MPKAIITGVRHEAAKALNNLGWSDPRLAGLFECSTSTVLIWRRRHGVPAVPGLGGSAEQKCDEARRLRLYQAGNSDLAIARAEGVGQPVITRWRQRRQLASNHPRGEPLSGDAERRAKALLLARLPMKLVAQTLGVSCKPLQRLRQELGPDPRLLPAHQRSAAASPARYRSGRTVPNLGPDLRRAAFISYADGMEDMKIAYDLNVDRTRIVAWRRRYGLSPNRARRQCPRRNRPLPAPISPTSNDLYRQAADSVPLSLSPDVRDDAISCIILAVLEKQLQLENIRSRAGEFIRKAISAAAERFQTISLEHPIGEGLTIADAVADDRAESDMRAVALRVLAERAGMDARAILTA